MKLNLTELDSLIADIKPRAVKPTAAKKVAGDKKSVSSRISLDGQFMSVAQLNEAVFLSYGPKFFTDGIGRAIDRLEQAVFLALGKLYPTVSVKLADGTERLVRATADGKPMVFGITEDGAEKYAPQGYDSSHFDFYKRRLLVQKDWRSLAENGATQADVDALLAAWTAYCADPANKDDVPGTKKSALIGAAPAVAPAATEMKKKK